MPFKLKLKRTKRYEVSSKNAFVVGVHMLDNSFLECTLTSDSKGGECLDSISQRIELTELQYFGLRYVTKKLQFRWVDLEKPLKKQLDKFAHSPRLYFGVLYYVASAHKMFDAVARYQYFLQLKTDIIDGRLPCTPEQAVRFAAYSLQAEIGDHDPERFTAEHFKDYLLLPKTMTKDEATMLELTKEILNAHRSLLGVPLVKAEIQYIKEVQLLDGYGMEYYLAKDSSGKELYLGTSYAGAFSRHLDGQPVVFFKWTEIANVSQSKRTLEIDTSKSSVQYQLEDADTAKYLCHMCHLQQKFYKSNKNTLNSSLSDVSIDNEVDLFSRPDIQQTVPPQTDIPDVVGGRHYSASKTLQNAGSQGSLTYAQDARAAHEYQQQVLAHEEYIGHSQQSLDQVLPDVQQHYVEGVVINENAYGQSDLQVQHPNEADPTYETRLAALPAYRAAPDYESVMRQRLLQQTVQQQQQQEQQQQHQVLTQQVPQPDGVQLNTSNLGNAQVYSQAQTIAYSQPEIRTSQYQQQEAQFHSSIYANVFHDSHGYMQYRSGDRATSQIIHPTYSTPELHTQLLTQHYSTENVMGEALSYLYKPPPPYPRASNSTPDLAIQTVKSNLSESPDLVSRRNLGMQADLVTQSRLDRSVENLSEDFQNSAMLNMDANSAIHMKPIVPSSEQDDRQSLEESSNIVASSYHTAESSSTQVSEEDQQRLLSSPFKQQSPQRLSGKSQHQSPCERKSSRIQIKYVAPGQAPPHSSSAEVATRRESFRRQMIANTSYMDARNASKRSLQGKDASGQSVLPPISDNASAKRESQLSTQSEVSVEGRGDNGSAGEPLTASSKEIVHQTVSGDSNTSSLDRLSLVDDNEQEGGIQRFHVGPLKMAALNGLTVSQPSMLAALNDETRAPKDDRRKNLENQLEEGRVFVEFEKVFRRDPAAEIKTASENESRNRFRDVLPYEHNRVKLTPKKDNSVGYINASHIKMESGGVEWWFIAAQAPMPNTVGDFWQMVWEYKIHVIAMLTDIVELGKQKCCQYWPLETGEENKTTHGEYEIVLQYRSDSLYYVTHTICVRHKPSKSERHVWHLQYTAWPDHGCPEDIFGFLGFLDEVESVQRMTESDLGGAKFPIIVHCSAGVGRTGVVILTAVMKSFLEHNQSIDLPKALAALRGQRMYMVQTVGQYSFVYKTLIQYLKNTRLI